MPGLARAAQWSLLRGTAGKELCHAASWGLVSWWDSPMCAVEPRCSLDKSVSWQERQGGALRWREDRTGATGRCKAQYFADREVEAQAAWTLLCVQCGKACSRDCPEGQAGHRHEDTGAKCTAPPRGEPAGPRGQSGATQAEF